MTSAKLIRWSGLALAVGGVCYVLFGAGTFLAGPATDPATLLTTTNTVAHGLAAIGALLILFGLVGMFVRQMEKGGTLGFGGFILAFIGTALTIGEELNVALLFPLIAANSPNMMGGNSPLTAPSFDVLLRQVTFVLGYLALAIATWRAGVFPRWAALLIAIGIVLMLLQLPGFFVVRVLGRIVFGVGLAWIGYVLGSTKGGMMARAESST